MSDTEERARCAGIARETAHLAKVGAIKFVNRDGTRADLSPLEVAVHVAEGIALQIEIGEPSVACNCEEKS